VSLFGVATIDYCYVLNKPASLPLVLNLIGLLAYIPFNGDLFKGDLLTNAPRDDNPDLIGVLDLDKAHL
jgi:hypothetical protein